MTPELEAWLLYEELLIMNKDFEEYQKYRNFVALEREFIERELLKTLREDDATEHESDTPQRSGTTG